MTSREPGYRCRTCEWEGPTRAARRRHVAEHPGHQITTDTEEDLPTAPPLIRRALEEGGIS